MNAKRKERHSHARPAIVVNQKDNDASKPGKYAMRLKGEPRYLERLQAYLSGDRTQVVSAAFAEAVDGLGKRRVDSSRLSKDEKAALIGRDLRWQRGPDGVLLWEPVSLDTTAPQKTPDFAWLLEGAQEVLRKQNEASGQCASVGTRSPCPSWLSEWAQAWVLWGYRFASLRFDLVLREAEASGLANPRAAAGAAGARMVANHRVFLLEYLPRSGLTETVRQEQSTETQRWLLPEELLNVEFHGEAHRFRDDFWNCCCDEHARSKGERGSRFNTIGATRSQDVQAFLDFLASKLNEAAVGGQRFRSPFLPRNTSGSRLHPVVEANAAREPSAGSSTKIDYALPIARDSDKTCSWISIDYPHLRAWEPFAREYIQDAKKNVSAAIRGLSLFFDRYLARAGEPGTPGEFLDPECAKRPIADEFGSEALLLLSNKEQVPKTLDVLSANKQKSSARSIRDGFIQHILTKHCSLVEGDHVALLPEYWNPFAKVELDDKPRSTGTETGRNAMPYRWIRRLRNNLVLGPHFCDWSWAQQAQQSEYGNSADWFEVDKSRIDRTDPDCVWRVRTTGSTNKYKERTFYEMWSPVRWVALVTKLNTALRTVQVRVLDSGESDKFRFDLRQWAMQTYPSGPEMGTAAAPRPSSDPKTLPGAHGTPWLVNDVAHRNRALHGSIAAQEAVRSKGAKRDPGGWMNGVLRPQWVHDPDADERHLATVLYINTNKTADAKKEGAAKGFQVALPLHTCPLLPDDVYWVRRERGESPVQRSFASTRQKQDWLDELGENTHWWLAKLRDWQAKYNPIDRRIDWKELSRTRLVQEKSDEQYEMYRPTCFLFREPSMNKTKAHPGAAYPLPDSVVVNAWWALLKDFQDKLNAERSEGQPEFRLVVDDTGWSKSCVYDLHSIRVSIITALIVEGKVPVQYVQALVGHSRIVMTIYYTKINPLTMMREISAGFSRATEAQVESEKQHIQNATVEELRTQLAFNDPASALAALGASRPPGSRNMVMWMRKLGGICPVGGVSHDTEGGLPAGCFNGGPLISGEGQRARHGPVEGGPGTCVNCRWFVTKMRFIGELQAIAENALYRYHEFKDKASLQEKKIESIKGQYEGLETAQGSLTNAQKVQFNRDLEAAEAVRDGYMESAALDVLISANAYGLIQRLVALQNARGSAEDEFLVTKGTEDEVKVILDQTDSAMLHAARICLHSEIHPEINASAATLRAAMIIARKLQEEDLDPFSLLSLPEEVQTRAVNAITRHIASLCDPTNLNIGLTKAVALMESKHKLSQITGASPIKLREWFSVLSDGTGAIPVLESQSHSLPLLAQEEAVSRNRPPNGTTPTPIA